MTPSERRKRMTEDERPKSDFKAELAEQLQKFISGSKAEGLELTQPPDVLLPKIGLDAPPEVIKRVQDLLSQHHGTFPKELEERTIPPDRGMPHYINLVPGHTPPKMPPHQLSAPEQAEVRKQLVHLFKHGFLSPSSSPASAGVLLVRKPGGKWRLCIDYRELNKVTVKDPYPLPRIDGIWPKLSKAKYFTKIDLFSGYWQVPISVDDRWKTAFSTEDGQFEWNVMPFGLTNAPATFQRMLNHIFADLLSVKVIIYIDDILIYSVDPDQHLKDVEEVLDRLARYQLMAKGEKSTIFTSRVEYLGYVIDASSPPLRLANLKS